MADESGARRSDTVGRPELGGVWRPATRVFDAQAPLPLGAEYDIVTGRPPLPLHAAVHAATATSTTRPSRSAYTEFEPSRQGPLATQHRLDGCHRLSIATAATHLGWVAPRTLYARVVGTHIAVGTLPHLFAAPVLLDSRVRLKLSVAMAHTVAARGVDDVVGVAVPTDLQAAKYGYVTVADDATRRAAPTGGVLLLMCSFAAAEALLALVADTAGHASAQP